jgi:uncharacterized protein (DUF433 family)
MGGNSHVRFLGGWAGAIPPGYPTPFLDPDCAIGQARGRMTIGIGSLIAMSKIRDIEELLPTLSRAEKAQLLKWVVQDLGDDFPGIEKTPGVCGGDARVVRTRIAVWVLEHSRRLGATDADLLQAYPTLRAEDLANVWAYVRSHGDEIEQTLRDNEAA